MVISHMPPPPLEWALSHNPWTHPTYHQYPESTRVALLLRHPWVEYLYPGTRPLLCVLQSGVRHCPPVLAFLGVSLSGDCLLFRTP